MQSRVLANRNSCHSLADEDKKKEKEIKTGNGLLQVLQPPVSDQTLLIPSWEQT